MLATIPNHPIIVGTNPQVTNTIEKASVPMDQQTFAYLNLQSFALKKDMGNEICKLNEQISHLHSGFDGCYYKDGKSTPIYETEAQQLQLKRIMQEHYERK